MSKGSGGGGHGGGGGGGKDGTVAGAGAAFAALPANKLGNTQDEVLSGDAVALKRSENLSKSISQEQRDAIQHYTSGLGYSEIRSADHGTGGTAEALRQANAINAAIRSAPKAQQTVYRGMSVTREHLQGLLKSKSIDINAVTSTSRHVDTAVHFVSNNMQSRPGGRTYGVILKIRQKSGVNVDSISHHRDEREVILAKGTRLKIDKMTRSTITDWYGKVPTLVIHAHEVRVPKGK